MPPHLPVDHDDQSLHLERTSDAYFEDDCFNPDGMLKKLMQFHHLSQSGGFTGGRVIGEMAPRIQDVNGAGRLLEYEARVNLLLRDNPMTVMCQYHVHSFSGSTLMDVLKAHALLVVRGAIVHNPYCIPPETLLGGVARITDASGRSEPRSSVQGPSDSEYAADPGGSG